MTMNKERRAILTKVPAEERMQIYAEFRKESQQTLIRWGLVIPAFSTVVAILMFMSIMPYPVLDEFDVMGIGIVWTIIFAMSCCTIGARWRPPSAEEMEELGDELI